MSATGLQRQGPGQWRLRGELSFDTVSELAGRAEELFVEDSVQIDLGEVERADSAGVALLVQWMSEARRRGAAIRYLNIPSQMLAIARVSSLDQILPLGRA